jgi:sRNA-binding regulator protein Hfq
VPQLDSTNAESYYYVKQIAANTPIVVTLKDGEEILGDLRWYDGSCITVRRHDGRCLLIPKHVIRTICKQAPERG